VRIAAQLVEASNVRVLSTAIDEEAAPGDVVVAFVAGLSAVERDSTARAKGSASGCWSGGRRQRFTR
jgi:hypothetical protein